MHVLILLLLLASGTFEYFSTLGWIPEVLRHLPEVIALVTAAIVVLAGAKDHFAHVHASYWLVFGALALVMFCGAIVNAVEPGPVFAGLRSYLRAIPLFFLPAVLVVRDRQIRVQLLLLLAVSLLQFPIALHQRMTTFALEYFSGDLTVGTMMTSAFLSLFLICGACVLTGFYMRRRMPRWLFLPLLLLILAPTMINETKATLLLLPVGLLTTFIAGSAPGRRLGNAVIATTVLALFTAIFIPVYDYFMKPRWGYGIVEFITMEGRVEGYISKDAPLGRRDAKQVGRVDSLVVPFNELRRDPVQLAFGLGLGNASDSALGLQFTGRYFRRYEPFLQSSASLLMLETGLLGLGLVILLHLLVLRDCRIVLRDDDAQMGALAAGWLGVTVVMTLAIFYKETTSHSALSFAYWYFAGIIAAHRMRLAHAKSAVRPVRAASVGLRGSAHAAR